jgi:hypothetical protein
VELSKVWSAPPEMRESPLRDAGVSAERCGSLC